MTRDTAAAADPAPFAGVLVLVTDAAGQLLLPSDSSTTAGWWPPLAGPLQAGEDGFQGALRLVWNEAKLSAVEPENLVELFSLYSPADCPATRLDVWAALLDVDPWTMPGPLVGARFSTSAEATRLAAPGYVGHAVHRYLTSKSRWDEQRGLTAV